MSFFILLLHLYELCQLGARNYRFRVQVLTNLQISFFDYEFDFTLFVTAKCFSAESWIDFSDNFFMGWKKVNFPLCDLSLLGNFGLFFKKKPKTWQINHPSQNYISYLDSPHSNSSMEPISDLSDEKKIFGTRKTFHAQWFSHVIKKSWFWSSWEVISLAGGGSDQTLSQNTVIYMAFSSIPSFSELECIVKNRCVALYNAVLCSMQALY